MKKERKQKKVAQKLSRKDDNPSAMSSLRLVINLSDGIEDDGPQKSPPRQAMDSQPPKSERALLQTIEFEQGSITNSEKQNNSEENPAITSRERRIEEVLEDFEKMFIHGDHHSDGHTQYPFTASAADFANDERIQTKVDHFNRELDLVRIGLYDTWDRPVGNVTDWRNGCSQDVDEDCSDWLVGP